MAKVYFDFGAASNGVGTSSSPYNALVTINPGDQVFFRRGTSYTGALSLTSGTSGQRTKYSAWYYPDGSDEKNLPKPILNLTDVMSTYSSANKENVELSYLDLRANSIAVASDTPLVYLGNNSRLVYCNIDTNVGAVAASGKSNVLIGFNTLTGVKHPASGGNNNVIAVSDSKAMDSISIIGNTIIHSGGGSTSSHCIRCESSDATLDLTNLIISNNIISPPQGITLCANTAALGIRVQRCPYANITGNTVRGMLSGVFVVGGGDPISLTLARNNFSYNMNFGIHLSTDTKACLLEYNICSYNGTNDTSLSAYGRGIEMTSAAGQGRCGYHIVRFNTCQFNKNYGGPADNGSEGVGIGLDDGCVGCYVYGNIVTDNEGNGIQQYGGGDTVTYTETGGNYIIANFLRNNCTASVVNRRSGGTGDSLFVAQIAFAGAYGRSSHIANNVIVGGKLGISVASNCTNVFISNNIISGTPHGIEFDGVPGNTFNNTFWKDTLGSMMNYCSMALVTNGPMSYTALTYTGTADSTIDPQLDTNFKPKSGSPCINSGYSIGGFNDANNRAFKNPPSVGMYETYASSVQPIHL